MVHERVVGLNVIDEAGYARYREGMMPILARYGGGFRFDLDVARVRKPSGVVINRLFLIYFPDQKAKDAFFSDPEYLAIRKKHFEPSVAGVTEISVTNTDD
jgi:uncharacterized protein (DUF1330 family)